MKEGKAATGGMATLKAARPIKSPEGIAKICASCLSPCLGEAFNAKVL